MSFIAKPAAFYETEHLGERIQAMQHHVVCDGTIRPDQRVAAILRLEKVRIAFVRAEMKAAEALDTIVFDAKDNQL